MAADPSRPQDEARRRASVGAAYALAAFGFWGANPIYFKAVDHVPALEVLAHRVVWSVLLLALLVGLGRRWRVVVAALADRRTVLMLLLSTLIISLNWLVYIWAVNVERVLETSLGYYINPLVSVLLGVAVLGERLSPWQGVAVLLAACGVANLALGVDRFPWVALVLAFSFGIYGLIRKTVRIESVDGLFVETGMMLPFALAYLLYLALFGQGSFGTADRSQDLLLALSGIVTAAPLIWFTSAARRLRLSTVGFFQYIAPSGHFLLAVFAFGEPFTASHLITFLLIWTALAIFILDSLTASRRRARTGAGEAVD